MYETFTFVQIRQGVLAQTSAAAPECSAPRRERVCSMADQFGYACSVDAPGAPQCFYSSFQEMGIKDDFHQKSILVCIDELCGQQTDSVSIPLSWLCCCVNLFLLLSLCRRQLGVFKNTTSPPLLVRCHHP